MADESLCLFYEKLRSAEFPTLDELTYLDHAGSTLASSSQLAEVHNALSSCIYGNPHSKGPSSKRTHDMMDQARNQVLEFFGTTNAEYDVVFTGGATSSVKLLGECFPISSCSRFIYALNSHTSLLGLRALFDDACVHSVSPRSIRTSTSASSISKCALSDVSASSPYHLLALPGECNFSGAKYCLSAIAEAVEEVNSGAGLHALVNRGWSISDSEVSGDGTLMWLLDVAKLAATSPLLLNSLPDKGRPHFVIASFYKIFGYPTGIGVLLLRRDVAGVMVQHKKYYGGGTVMAVAADANYMSRSNNIDEVHRVLEDGTPNYHGIAALKYGFAALQRAGGMRQIQIYTHYLASEFARQLLQLQHAPLPGQNNKSGSFCEVYGCYADGTAELHSQGPIVTFNLRWSNGQYIGFSEVGIVASLHNIQLRTGCFCCIGGCQEALGLSAENIQTNASSGRNCWDESADIINGKPTGAVRVSFGYSSTRADIDRIVHVFTSCFLNQRPVSPSTPIASPSLQLRLHSLYVYPIKSCAGLRAVRWPISGSGLLYDREWAICDSRSGRALTQKHHPSLALCTPSIDWSMGIMRVSAPGMTPLMLSIYAEAPNSTHRDIRICRENCSAVSTSAQADEWFSEYLKTPCALVRQASAVTAARSFANEAQYLLLSTSSVAALAEMLRSAFPEDAKDLLPSLSSDGSDFDTLSRVFRPNILLSGLSADESPAAHEEDNWKHIRLISNSPTADEVVQMSITGPCSRCSMVNINPNTGSMDGHTLKVLSSYRRQGTNIHFGQFLKLSEKNQEVIEKMGLPHCSADLEHYIYLEVGMLAELT